MSCWVSRCGKGCFRLLTYSSLSRYDCHLALKVCRLATSGTRPATKAAMPVQIQVILLPRTPAKAVHALPVRSPESLMRQRPTAGVMPGTILLERVADFWLREQSRSQPCGDK